jgi:hypothetical protein
MIGNHPTHSYYPVPCRPELQAVSIVSGVITMGNAKNLYSFRKGAANTGMVPVIIGNVDTGTIFYQGVP